MTLGLDPAPAPGSTSARVTVLAIAALVLLVGTSVVARSWPVRIDAATLVVVFLALETNFHTGLWASLLIGYLAGLYAGVPAGLDAAVAVALFAVLRVFVARIVGSRWVMVTTVATIATFGAIAGRLFVHGLFQPIPWPLVLPSIPGQLVASVILAWPAYRLLRAVQTQLTPRDERG